MWLQSYTWNINNIIFLYILFNVNNNLLGIFIFGSISRYGYCLHSEVLSISTRGHVAFVNFIVYKNVTFWFTLFVNQLCWLSWCHCWPWPCKFYLNYLFFHTEVCMCLSFCDQIIYLVIIIMVVKAFVEQGTRSEQVKNRSFWFQLIFIDFSYFIL
jgi:hypothetical protein